MWQLFGCILIRRYVTKQCSLLGRRPSAEFSGKMHKFLISLADFPSTLAFLTLLMLAMLAFPLMFISGIMSVFYLTQLVFLVYILDMIKQHETNLSVKKINILFGIPQYIKH